MLVFNSELLTLDGVAVRSPPGLHWEPACAAHSVSFQKVDSHWFSPNLSIEFDFISLSLFVVSGIVVNERPPANLVKVALRISL